MNVFSFVAALAFAVFLLQGLQVLRRTRRSRAARPFALLCAVFAAWALGFAFFVAAPNEAAAWRWWHVTAVCWVVAPPLLLHLLVALTRDALWLRRAWQVALLYLPAGVLLARLAVAPLLISGLVATPLGWDVELAAHDPWTWIYLAYCISFVSLGLYRVHRWGAGATRRAERGQARLVVLTGATTFALILVSNWALRLLHVHALPGLAPLLLFIWVGGTWRAMTRYQLFSVTPAVSSDEIVAAMADGLLLLAHDGRILSANPAAAALFALPAERLAGQNIAALLPWAALFSQDAGGLERAFAEHPVHAFATSASGLADRALDVRAAAVRDEVGQLTGVVVTVREVPTRAQSTAAEPPASAEASQEADAEASAASPTPSREGRERGEQAVAAPPAAPAAPPAHPALQPAIDATSRKGLVLIIDDEPVVLSAATAILRRIGYDVLAMTDALQAVETFRAMHDQIDAVIVDLVMPQMSGHECFLSLRAIDPEVRTLLCSGFGLDGMVQEALDDGVHSFIAKPYRIDDLTKKLEETMGGPATDDAE